jgi:quercetin dioxygenase-like cupin family protein
LFEAPEPARVRGASVTFEPGARTAWHTHPLGQTLIVISGLGWAQRDGGPVEEIRPGDVVWFAPNEKHWHGATPTTAMTHIAIHEALDGKLSIGRSTLLTSCTGENKKEERTRRYLPSAFTGADIPPMISHVRSVRIQVWVIRITSFFVSAPASLAQFILIRYWVTAMSPVT